MTEGKMVEWAFFKALCPACGTNQPMGVNIKGNSFMCYVCFANCVTKVWVDVVELPFTIVVGDKRPEGWKLALQQRLYETYGLAAEFEKGQTLTFQEAYK